jgi:CheY-like chemotaxis protein
MFLSLNVLVVDDDAGLQDLLQAILELEDHEVIIAENGLVALEKIEQVKPDLIFLDLMMPYMDGFAFTKELQRRGLRSFIPIIVLTADARAQATLEHMGFDSYLTKPFDLRCFLDEMRKLLAPVHSY